MSGVLLLSSVSEEVRRPRRASPGVHAGGSLAGKVPAYAALPPAARSTSATTDDVAKSIATCSHSCSARRRISRNDSMFTTTSHAVMPGRLPPWLVVRFTCTEPMRSLNWRSPYCSFDCRKRRVWLVRRIPVACSSIRMTCSLPCLSNNGGRQQLGLLRVPDRPLRYGLACSERRSTASSRSWSRFTGRLDLISGMMRRKSFARFRPTAASMRPPLT